MAKEYNYIEIEEYLSGKMQPAQKAAFETKIANDPALATEVEAHNVLHEALMDEKLIRLKQEFQKIDYSALNKPNKNVFQRFGKEMIGLATLATISILWFAVDVEKEAPNKQESIQTTSEKSTKTIKEEVESPSITSPHKKETEAEVSKKTVKTSSTKVLDIRPEEITEAKQMNEPVEADISIKENEKSLSEMQITEEDVSAPQKSIMPCDTTVISADFKVQDACLGDDNGQVIISDKKITGGKAPYNISIRNNKISQRKLDNLQPGNYEIQIVDKNGCLSIGIPVNVGAKACATSLAFAPGAGELLRLPENFESYSFLVFNQKGVTVFKKEYTNQDKKTWDGISFDGKMLPSGSYPFKIMKEGEILSHGHISITQ